MLDELIAIESNQTWDLVPQFPRLQVTGSKWVYSLKLQPNGSLERYKAHLVAHGFKQEYGIDYEETLAQRLKIGTRRATRSCPI